MLNYQVSKVLFEEAIADFEKYLKMYEDKKMSRENLLLKVRGMIFNIFLLMDKPN